jgi:hypothetical protein
MAEKKATPEHRERSTKFQASLELTYLGHPSDIRFANMFRFSQLGSDVFMDVGTIDDQAFIASVAKGETNKTISGYVHQRYGMSTRTLMQLKRNLDEILEKMRASGAIESSDRDSE